MSLKTSLAAVALLATVKYAFAETPLSVTTKVLTISYIGLFVVGVLIAANYIYLGYFSPLRHLPGPEDHHFLLGQALNQFRARSPNEPFVSWVKKWPDADFIRFVTFGNSEALLVTSLAAHKEILQAKTYSFVKPPFFKRLIVDIVGLGIVFSEGEEHKKQRKAFRNLFSLGNLKAFLPLFQSKAELLSGLLDRAIAKDGGIVELVSVCSRLTLDIIGVFGLGVDLESLTSEHSVFEECYHEVFDPPTAGLILTAINAFVPIRWLPVKANQDFNRANGIVHSMLSDIIKKRVGDVRDAKKQGKPVDAVAEQEKSKDLLTFMVEEKYFAENGDNWSEDDMLNQVLNVVAGGHETTASLFVWAIHVLCIYPDVGRRLHTEISRLLRHSPRPDYSEIESLRYLNNFMREVLRVHCPAVNAPREAGEDVVIRGVLIPKGTTILTMPAAVQHNPSIWGPDADVFDPDRWDNLSGEAADPYAFAAFSQGPRICIGRAFATIEFKAIMIELVSNFRSEKVGEGEVELINPSVLLRPRGGLKVKVVRRE